VIEHFQRDVLAEMDYRMSWVAFAIKTAPMLGLLGTVLGMMGAFANLASGDKVDPTGLANDISFALITTAVGLAIAVPLMLVSAIINIRIRKMEDRVSVGLTRLFTILKPFVGRSAAK
jgi:biopolymer transport protein ExbB/TolQ